MMRRILTRGREKAAVTQRWESKTGLKSGFKMRFMLVSDWVYWNLAQKRSASGFEREGEHGGKLGVYHRFSMKRFTF